MENTHKAFNPPPQSLQTLVTLLLVTPLDLFLLMMALPHRCMVTVRHAEGHHKCLQERLCATRNLDQSVYKGRLVRSRNSLASRPGSQTDRLVTSLYIDRHRGMPTYSCELVHGPPFMDAYSAVDRLYFLYMIDVHVSPLLTM